MAIRAAARQLADLLQRPQPADRDIRVAPLRTHCTVSLSSIPLATASSPDTSAAWNTPSTRNSTTEPKVAAVPLTSPAVAATVPSAFGCCHQDEDDAATGRSARTPSCRRRTMPIAQHFARCGAGRPPVLPEGAGCEYVGCGPLQAASRHRCRKRGPDGTRLPSTPTRLNKHRGRPAVMV